MSKDEKIIKYNNIEYRYSSEWIHKLESLNHWILYWHQISMILELAEPNDKILEIGVGSGFSANYLRNKNFDVVTFDIDDQKKPDIVGNLVEYKFKETYDIILAFEVFEHIPYHEMEHTLSRLKETCKKYLILSVPMNKKTWFKIDIKTLLFNIHFSFSTNRNKLTTRHHFWEVDYKNYSSDKFIKSLKENGFKLLKKMKVDNTLFFQFQVV